MRDHTGPVPNEMLLSRTTLASELDRVILRRCTSVDDLGRNLESLAQLDRFLSSPIV